MIEGFDSSKQPNLSEFPSAQAQDVAPVPHTKAKRKPRYRMMRIFSGVLFSCLLLLVVAGGAAYFVLSKGPVSNDRLRTSIEAQISDILGDGRSARIGDAKFALGKGGLISIDAKDVKILQNSSVNLGIAGEVAVTVKALPLLRGNVVAKKVRLQKASVSLAPFWSTEKVSDGSTEPLPKFKDVDVKGMLSALHGMLEQMAEAVDDTGLEEISLTDTKLIGFDELGLKSRTARVIELTLEKNLRFQEGLYLKAEIEMNHANLQISGTWRRHNDGRRLLSMQITGGNVSEFLGDAASMENDYFYAEAPMRIRMQAPFLPGGVAQQALVAVELGDGRFKISDDHKSRLAGAQFNFRVLPEKNQIELERSPIIFPHAKAVLIGGLRFPHEEGESATERLMYEIIANDVVSNAMFAKKPAGKGAMRVTGWFDRENLTAHMDEIVFKTESGDLGGKGKMGFEGGSPSLELDLNVAKMSVADFKQFWPPFFATGARDWVKEGVNGGTIKGAKLKANIPSGILGNIEFGARLEERTLALAMPISGATVKTFGDLPPIQNVSGTIHQRGIATAIELDEGVALMPNSRKLALSNGRLSFADFSADSIDTKVRMKVSGSAASLVHVGTYKGLDFASSLGMKPKDLSGSGAADVTTKFQLNDGGRISGLDWTAKVGLKKFSSKAPVQGRRFQNANLTISAKPGEADIKGTAKIDGVNANVAMVEYFGNSKKAGRSSVTLRMSDAERKKLGIDLGEIMQGPIEVALTSGSEGKQHVDVDLRDAKLNLPWIKWSKGKGISATASFDLRTSKGQTRLTNFVLRGAGFKAQGSIVSDKNGLVEADLKKVRLNKTDDFDVRARRIRGGYDIKIKARSYDGRAIIQTLINENDSKTTEAGNVKVSVSGTVGKLIGFGGQTLNGVSIKYVQQKGSVRQANVKAVAAGGAPTVLTMKPTKKGMQTRVESANAGAVLRFLDIYTKVSGGSLTVNLVKDGNGFNVGEVTATNFFLLDEPRIGKLLTPPTQSARIGREAEAALRKVKKVDPRRVKVRNVNARVKMGKKYLEIRKGNMRGGDAGAAFRGIVYDQRNRTKMKGTFLPAYGLNRAISKIPLIGLAFGNGKKRGLIGITFKMVGPYKNPELIVNPISLLTPGIFRKLFEF